jgi:16S rRNA processing protein RimM
MARPSYDPDSLLLGVIGRPHGLDGEITLRPHNRSGTDLTGVPALILERGDAREERGVRSVRRGVDAWLVRLEGINSQDAAAALTHVQVRVRKNCLPPLGQGEFFVEDLLGCLVQTDKGVVLGDVVSVFWNGAQDVMSIARRGDAECDADPELLIPVVPAFVVEVDVPARRIIVAWDDP